jgi:hypothetical protein
LLPYSLDPTVPSEEKRQANQVPIIPLEKKFQVKRASIGKNVIITSYK